MFQFLLRSPPDCWANIHNCVQDAADRWSSGRHWCVWAQIEARTSTCSSCVRASWSFVTGRGTLTSRWLRCAWIDVLRSRSPLSGPERENLKKGHASVKQSCTTYLFLVVHRGKTQEATVRFMFLLSLGTSGVQNTMTGLSWKLASRTFLFVTHHRGVRWFFA